MTMKIWKCTCPVINISFEDKATIYRKFILTNIHDGKVFFFKNFNLPN